MGSTRCYGGKRDSAWARSKSYGEGVTGVGLWKVSGSSARCAGKQHEEVVPGRGHRMNNGGFVQCELDGFIKALWVVRQICHMSLGSL